MSFKNGKKLLADDGQKPIYESVARSRPVKLPKARIDGMPYFTLFDHVHTIYESQLPNTRRRGPFFSPSSPNRICPKV